MELKEISALPIALADEKARELTEGELSVMDVEMRQIETVNTFLDFEWGYRFYIGCLKDEQGIKNYKKIGWDTQDEWIASFKSVKRRTAQNRKAVYRLWALYLYMLPLPAFFEVHTSKILTIAKEIEKHAGDEQKLTELLEEASALTRKQLEDKYRKGKVKVWATFDVANAFIGSDGKWVVYLYAFVPDHKFDMSPQTFLKMLGRPKRTRGSFELMDKGE